MSKKEEHGTSFDIQTRPLNVQERGGGVSIGSTVFFFSNVVSFRVGWREETSCRSRIFSSDISRLLLLFGLKRAQ